MFDTGVFDEQEVEVEKVVSTAEVSTASATTTTINELTLAQTLIKIKAAKPKAITTATATPTTAVTRPKARGVVVQEPSEFTTINELTINKPSEMVVSTAEVTTASATTTTINELTLAQTLIEIKAAKPMAVRTAAATPTTAITRPKARGVVVQEPSEFTTTTSQPSQLQHAKDKGKGKMVDPEKPLKKKDQILMDEEIGQRLQEELQDELEEEERLARQK
ncbi:hypothetical protein Tco_1578435 [Tanacetum coccineum]